MESKLSLAEETVFHTFVTKSNNGSNPLTKEKLIAAVYTQKPIPSSSSQTTSKEDNEEDESWKDWGKKASTPEFDPPPDFSNMGFEQIQAEMAKRTFGPVVGFVKLRLGVRRTKDMVVEIAMKWTKVLRTGRVGVRFMAVDRSTVMFNMQSGKEVNELKRRQSRSHEEAQVAHIKDFFSWNIPIFKVQSISFTR
ncbi:unnamed protein product [Thlaspi arvense]|uniref:Uncharacterized protein n=1 Tax=Thlaspi arvense TaxID=13288 RepID=A0AAU9S935_THLAR|nr:unnamed protein product [Thlaspi arvense]